MASSVQPCRFCGWPTSEIFLERVPDYVTGELFEIRRCPSCRVAFTSPQPPSLRRFYPASYRRYGGITHAILRRLYHWRARSWTRIYGARGTALEIGCGAGWMLRALRRRGWTVVGNERTVESATAASRLGGLPIFVGTLAAVKAEPRFDLIILFQVLEHLPDPFATLQQCARLLKPGGNLVIAVPNLQSWQARFTGRSWFHLDVPRHLFHFSPQSLSRVLQQTGLTVRGVRFVSFEHDPYGWGQSVLNLLGFEQNLLTKMLMGMENRRGFSLAGMAMTVVGGLLLVPSVLLAVGSWLVGAGASFEIVAVKPRQGGTEAFQL